LLNFRFDHPDLLWLCLLAGPVVWLGMRSLAALEPVRRYTAIALRLLVLLLLILMLAGLQAVRRHSDLTVIAVVDQSESVRKLARPPSPASTSATHPQDNGPPSLSIEQWTKDFLRRSARDRRSDDRFGVVTFDARPTVRAMPAPAIDLDPGTIEQPMDGTDIAAAIRAAMALFPPDSGARLILFTDGNDTASQNALSQNTTGRESDLLAAAREAAAAGIAIDVVPLAYQAAHEVMVEALYSPIEAREGQTVALRVVLRATSPTDGAIQLIHDDLPVDLNGSAPGTGQPVSTSDWTEEHAHSDPNTPGRFVAVRQIELPLAYPGANRFQAVFEPARASADALTINNAAAAFTLVAGKGRILFIDNIGGDSGRILPDALASHGVELDLLPPSAIPGRLNQLQRYDAIILQNVPADLVSTAQQQLLARYVNDLGGGLIMLGGPDSFGAGGWTNSPVDRILPVNCEIPSQTILPSGAIVIVLDRSGSMSSAVAGSSKSQQDVANEAAVLALSTLYPDDLVGVVAFDSTAKWIVNVQPNRDPASVARHVRSIQPAGGTDIYVGLEQAYRALAPLNMQDAAIKHVILLTDGQSVEPQPGGYVKLVGQMMKANITLSTIGVGDGHDAQLLNQLAQMGGGQFHPVTNPHNLPQVFIKEAKTIRKNLVKEGLFQPTLLNTGSPIMAGFNAVPPLTGLVLTGPKHDPRVFMPIVGAEGEPLFAHWQVGLGRSAAFTSDATNRWAVQWLAWGGYADFWSRTIRSIARPAATRDIDFVASLQGDQLKLRLDATAADVQPTDRRSATPAFGNFLAVRGSALAPNGQVQPITLQQTGPGIYQAIVPADQPGNYIVSLFVDQPDGSRRAVFGGASKPPGAELRRFESNLPILRQVADITNGRWIDPASNPPGLFERTREFDSRSIRPLWRHLLLWLVIFFLLDVACRRIAWDAHAIWAFIRSRGDAALGLLRPREVHAEATLAALKSRRNEVADKLNEYPPAPPPKPAAPAPPKTQKFQAQDDFLPEGDFTQAVGGAKNEPAPRPPGPTEGTQQQNADEAATTSRLLAAKRRAQQHRDDHDQ
jgi:Mg-chelatase subunit ChlD